MWNNDQQHFLQSPYQSNTPWPSTTGSVTARFLTILSFKVSEAEFGALGGDEDLSIEGEDHGLVLHVDHTAHHVPSVPAPPK